MASSPALGFAVLIVREASVLPLQPIGPWPQPRQSQSRPSTHSAWAPASVGSMTRYVAVASTPGYVSTVPTVLMQCAPHRRLTSWNRIFRARERCPPEGILQAVAHATFPWAQRHITARVTPTDAGPEPVATSYPTDGSAPSSGPTAARRLRATGGAPSPGDEGKPCGDPQPPGARAAHA